MGDRRRKHCRVCNGHVDEVGELSWAGNCTRCGQEALASNVIQMYARTGPNWTRWRRGMAGTVGGVLLDDIAERP